MTLSWTLSNRHGIEWAGGWHAGHVNDVLELDSSSVLAASASGGVWLLTSSRGVSLSMGWDAVDTTILVRGPHGPNHVYCGAGTVHGTAAIYETDTSAPSPLTAPWKVVPVASGMGAIRALVVDGSTSTLIAATSTGLWVAPILPVGGTYVWSQPAGVPPTADVQSIAQCADRGVLAATAGAFYRGDWTGPTLAFVPATVTGLAAADMAYVRVAASPSSAGRAYATCCRWAPDYDQFSGILRTEDGGRTWSARSAHLGGSLVIEHSSYGYTGAVAVHPTDPNTVVLGYTAGPYVSRDGGDTLVATDRGATHDDKHAYHFTASGRLYEANDGGVTYTDDLGATFHSEYSQWLANLQFLGPSSRDWWGRTTASYQHPGLFGGGLQDNSDVYCLRSPDGSSTPWKTLPPWWQYDGQAITFLRDGTALFSYGDMRSARWAPPDLVADPDPIPIRVPRPGVTRAGDGLTSGPHAIVNSPQWRNGDGNLMFAVAISHDSDVYGLFARDDGSDKHWNYLVSVPLESGSVASAIQCGSGHYVLVGTRGRGDIFRIALDGGAAVTPMTGLPSSTAWTAFVLDILEQNENPWNAYAIWADPDGGSSGLFRCTDGTTWTRVPGLPNEVLYCMATDWTTNPKTLFVATDTAVYVSRDEGSTWHAESSGLPARPHCSDFAFVTQPDGQKLLHLSTFGWSTWITPVA